VSVAKQLGNMVEQLRNIDTFIYRVITVSGCYDGCYCLDTSVIWLSQEGLADPGCGETVICAKTDERPPLEWSCWVEFEFRGGRYRGTLIIESKPTIDRAHIIDISSL